MVTTNTPTTQTMIASGFDGILDEARVYDTALAPEQISALYNQGR